MKTNNIRTIYVVQWQVQAKAMRE